MATFTRDKNIITITFTDNESYRYDINYGQIYGKKGTLIKTMPKKVKDAFISVQYSREHNKDIIGFIGRMYCIKHSFDIATVDKLINIGVDFSNGCPYNFLEVVNSNWSTFLKFLKTAENKSAYRIAQDFSQYLIECEKTDLIINIIF